MDSNPIPEEESEAGLEQREPLWSKGWQGGGFLKGKPLFRCVSFSK